MEAARDQAYANVAASNVTIMSLTQSRDRANAAIQQMAESRDRAVSEQANRVHQLWLMYSDQLNTQRVEQNEAFEFQQKQFEEQLQAKQKKIDSLEKALLEQEGRRIDAKQRKIESLEKSLLEKEAEWANKLAAKDRSLVQSEKETMRVREVARSQIEALKKRIAELTEEVKKLPQVNKLKETKVEQSSSSLSSTSPARKVGPKGSASKAGDDFKFHGYCEFNSSHFNFIAGCIEASSASRNGSCFKVGCHVFFASQTSMTSCMHACSGLRSQKRRRPGCHSH